jgi:uncharacterized protein YbjT (DUF2867 family)
MKINAIVTGTTGMVGEGVLRECLLHPDVDKVLVINRRPCGVTHPKLAEIIHADFFDLSPLKEMLKGYNSCFFCLGVSSVGLKEDKYYSLTYTLTMHVAEILSQQNPGMTFCYVSGAGTDSSEKGRTMWARVKGKTENDLMKMPFKGVYNFRPGFIKPFLPLKPNQTFYTTYKFVAWLFPLLKLFAPSMIITLKELAAAMINACLIGYSKNILEVKDIKDLAKK